VFSFVRENFRNLRDFVFQEMEKTRNILQFLGISWVATCSSAFGKMLQATHDSRHLMLIDAAGDPR
jgi:hypothetical protein